MDRFLVILVAIVSNIILVSAALLVFLNSYPKQQNDAEVSFKQNIGCCDDENKATDEQNSTIISTRIIFQPDTATIGSMEKDGIIRGWLLNKKLLKKGKNYPNITLTDSFLFRIEDKGIYTINSFVSFWKGEQPDGYGLFVNETGSFRPIHSCISKPIVNPNIRSCYTKTEMNVENQISFYFKVRHPDAKVLMSSSHSSVEIITRKERYIRRLK